MTLTFTVITLNLRVMTLEVMTLKVMTLKSHDSSHKVRVESPQTNDLCIPYLPLGIRAD